MGYISKGDRITSAEQDIIDALATLGSIGQVLTVDAAGTSVEWTTNGAGDVLKVGTPVDNQIGVWTGNGTIEGTSGLTYDGSNLGLTGDIGITGTRITKGWFTDLEVTNVPTIGGNALGTIYAAIGQTFYIGTTEVAINRASAALTLAGITLTTPDIGTPSDGALTNCDGLPAAGVVNTAVTLSDAQTITGVKTLGTTGAVKLGSAVTDKCDIQLNDSALNDETWSGTVVAGTLGATIAVGDVVYLQTSDSRWELVDGILDGTDVGFKLKLGICLVAGNDGSATKILLDGLVASAAFPTFTVGAPVYLDDTAGDLVVAQPSTTNFVVRVVGEAVSATVLHFHPSNDYIVHI